jgi:hypothetical protein
MLRDLHHPQIKQIAGRAGRFGVINGPIGQETTSNVGGYVTALLKDDMQPLREGMATPNPPLKQAMLWPPWPTIENFAQQFPEGTPLASMLSRFTDICKTSNHYRSVETDGQIILAQAIEHVPNIDLESRYAICFAPVPVRADGSIEFFIKFATVLSTSESVTIESPSLALPLDLLEERQKEVAPRELELLENLHKIITCYCWLS